MRRLLLISVLLFCAIPAHGTITHVGTPVANFNNSATSINCVYTPNAANDALIVSGGTTNTGVTLSVSGGPSWTSITSVDSGGAVGKQQAWVGISTSTSQITVTVSQSGTATFIGCQVDEFSGVSTSTPIDNSSTGSCVSSCGAPSVNVTPNTNNTAVYGSAFDSLPSSSWAGTGYTGGVNDTDGDGSEYKILSGGSGVSQTVNWTGAGTGGWTQIDVTLAPSGGGPCAPKLTLMGVERC